MTYLNKNILLLLFYFLFLSLYAQSQEEILQDLREDNVLYKDNSNYPQVSQLENLQSIYKQVKLDLENKEDKKAIQDANRLEKSGFTSDKINLSGKSELTETELTYIKIRRLRAEAFYNLREFKNALPDSKYIVETHPKPVVFDYTRYAVSLYYSGQERLSKKILLQARSKFKNQNDQEILTKTLLLLFPKS